MVCVVCRALSLAVMERYRQGQLDGSWVILCHLVGLGALGQECILLIVLCLYLIMIFGENSEAGKELIQDQDDSGSAG